jgi:hypothetical protein
VQICLAEINLCKYTSEIQAVHLVILIKTQAYCFQLCPSATFGILLYSYI